MSMDFLDIIDYGLEESADWRRIWKVTDNFYHVCGDIVNKKQNAEMN